MFKLAVLLCVLGCASAQLYKVCAPSTEQRACSNMQLGDSQVTCVSIESRIDCAINLVRGAADIGAFSEEETVLLGLQQPNDIRVVATIRDASRAEPYAFEAVAIVPSSFTGGLDGLRGFNYCHPGFDSSDVRWSPRVLKAFESAVAGLNQCPGETPPGTTVDEMEIEQLERFFPNACRPGTWSYNETIDASLKSRFPSLCSLCGNNATNASCAGYTLEMGVSVAGVNNNNRHVQALECLLVNSNNASGNNAVAYVAWQHVREYFTIRNVNEATSYAVLCPDGAVHTLTSELLASTLAPCAFVRQPWATIVTPSANATAVLASLRSWFPDGNSPASGWQSTLFSTVITPFGGATARVYFEDSLPSVGNYTAGIRPIQAIDATTSCQPARRWCTLSAAEQTKCSWIRAAAYSLGIQPTISCQQRQSIFDCLSEIKENRVDFVASSSNYGYLARQHYSLSPIKLLQNQRAATMRIAAFVKETTAQNNVTRFENLRGKKACFPEYGGIAYVSFLRAAQERGVISASECDYLRAVGEFFDGACAPGAMDASHSLSQSSFNASTLCTVCQPTVVTTENNGFTCNWDWTNRFFGNNGTVACLADPTTDFAVLRINNMEADLAAQGLQASSFRALCRTNTLAATAGVNVDDDCLLAHIVDAEVVTRRNDPLNNALSVLLETLEVFFGFAAENGVQLINLEIFSPFDKVSDLLFKDSAIGFTEPSTASSNEQARNHVELFRHLQACTGAASGLTSNTVFSFVTMMLMALLTRFVVY